MLTGTALACRPEYIGMLSRLQVVYIYGKILLAPRLDFFYLKSLYIRSKCCFQKFRMKFTDFQNVSARIDFFSALLQSGQGQL